MLATKKHLLVSRLVVFNETFASKTEGVPDYLISWHEAITGRMANGVTPSYIRLLRECRNNKEVLIWADHCAGQNMNWIIFTAMVQCVNTCGPDSVSLKYQEKGHTFMAAGGLHGEIGKVLNKEKQVVTFSDSVKVCSKTSRKSKRIIMAFYP